GCVVDNVETVTAIYKAVMLGRPVIDRIVTVTGDAVSQPKNFLVSTGTNMSELVEAAGGFKSQPEKIVSGGPMMGFSMYGLDIPCTKTSSAILSFLQDEVSHVHETACINCGRCVTVCPGHVVPARLATYALQGDMEKFQKYDGMECCECGCCSYICPAKRPLTQSIKSMRKMVLASRKRG
ncbi:MAG: SLBB domain-containing protein, partial [Blautia sp.]